VQIFQKPYLSHLDFELDVLYMDLNLLDESYPMEESKLPFEDFVHGGLTGLAQTCQFWVSTYAPYFFSKACVLKIILSLMKHFPLAISS
jgi:hypothetical protein